MRPLGSNKVARLNMLAVRPDIFDPGGMARYMRGFLGVRTGLIEYAVDPARFSVQVDPRMARDESYRPSIACAVLRSVKLGTLRFASLQESRFDPRGSSFDRKHHTRWVCHDSVVALKGTRGKVVVCSRAYKRFAGLYDVLVRLATVDSSKRALHSTLNMQGVPFDAAMSFARRYVESIEWNR